MVAAGHIINKDDVFDPMVENDLVQLIERSEFYDGVPLNQDDRNRIRTVLDVIFYYAKNK